MHSSKYYPKIFTEWEENVETNVAAAKKLQDKILNHPDKPGAANDTDWQQFVMEILPHTEWYFPHVDIKFEVPIGHGLVDIHTEHKHPLSSTIRSLLDKYSSYTRKMDFLKGHALTIAIPTEAVDTPRNRQFIELMIGGQWLNAGISIAHLKMVVLPCDVPGTEHSPNPESWLYIIFYHPQKNLVISFCIQLTIIEETTDITFKGRCIINKKFCEEPPHFQFDNPELCTMESFDLQAALGILPKH